MKTKIYFAVLLLYIVELVDCADDEDSTISRSKADSKLTIITSLLLSLIDLAACLYILGRTYLQWKQNDKNSISMNLRFPFYIASIELFISILQIINWSHPTVGDNWLYSTCSTIWFFTMFSLAFVMSLVTLISFKNWYKIKRGIEFNSGRYDYIIFLISIGFSVFYTLLGVGKYGKGQFWCEAQSDNRTVPYIILAVTLIHISLLLIFYINTRTHVKRFKTNQLSFNGQDLSAEDSYERKIAMKVNSYILAYGGQLALLIISVITSVFASENAAVSLIRVLGVTIGGFLIAIQYIINEGWKNKPIQIFSLEKRLSQSSSLQTSTTSVRDSISQTPGIRLPFTRIQVEVVRQQTTTQENEDWTG